MNIYTREHLDAIGDLASQPAPTPAAIERLNGEFGDQLASQITIAARLQTKAREKLGPGTWWVTEKSLQQATPWQVAQVKAKWFSDRPVYDMCCGIGGDCLQLSRRGPVVGVELDPSLARMAAANLHDQSLSAVVCTDCLTYRRIRDAAIHIDPDRRAAGRRSSRPDLYQPPWAAVVEMIGASAAAIVKLAPAAEVDSSGIADSHRVWISLRGSVREQTLVCGDLVASLASSTGHSVDQVSRSAIVVHRDGSKSHFVPALDANVAATSIERPASVMVDPDAAIRAAGLTDALARQYQLATLGGPAGFLTGGDLQVPRSLAVAERVIWSGSSDNRQLRRELRKRDLYPDRIKTRGTDIAPEKLRKRLRQCGQQPATLWIGRTDVGRYAALTIPAEKVSPAAEDR